MGAFCAILKLADKKKECFFVTTHHHVNGDDGLMLTRKTIGWFFEV